MSAIRVARRPFSWPALATVAAEAVAVCGFVIAVYEVVVGGGIALGASDNWIFLLWIAAAAITGSGLTGVRSGARALVRRVLPRSGPYPALMSSVSGVVAAGPAEDGLSRLAEVLAEGTGARSAAVWLAGPAGWRRASHWPPGDAPGPAGIPGAGMALTGDGGTALTGDGEAALAGLAGVDHVAPVRDADQVLGALTLQARSGRDLTPADRRLAADVANAAGLLLRNAELRRRLGEQVRVGAAQAAELTTSRRRMVVARDAAREQLGAEIQARVCEPLERCVARAELARPGRAESLAGRRLAAELAEMTTEIDAAIADFRRIVHGVHPPVLTDHGLLAAMESLLAGLDAPAELVTHRIPRLAGWVETGTYFCAAALLREWDQAGAQRPLRVMAGVTRKLVQMAFIDGVPDTAARPDLPVSPMVLEAVQDRVTALEGRLRAGRDASGRWLVIEVPLAPADLAAPRVRRKARR